ncbi:MAG: bifunctional DNA primase/polymerase, partial [Rubrobacteraceae bacterium]|nr:bifunctional DNA primase/polymerase [Rubrobacteraceae bacterium]
MATALSVFSALVVRLVLFRFQTKETDAKKQEGLGALLEAELAELEREFMDSRTTVADGILEDRRSSAFHQIRLSIHHPHPLVIEEAIRRGLFDEQLTSGLLVPDVDQFAGLEALEAEQGKLPATRTHSTGSGGMHYLYCYPHGDNIRNSAGKLAPGIDVRGEGGYVVAPPSATTRPYEVLERLPLAAPPEWLTEALRRPQSAARSRSDRPGPGRTDTRGRERRRADEHRRAAARRHPHSRSANHRPAGGKRKQVFPRWPTARSRRSPGRSTPGDSLQAIGAGEHGDPGGPRGGRGRRALVRGLDRHGRQVGAGRPRSP